MNEGREFNGCVIKNTYRTLGRRACMPVPKATDPADLNRQLLSLGLAEGNRTVAHQSQTIGQNFEREKSAAMALAAHRFDACVKRVGLMNKHLSVMFETHRTRPHSSELVTATVKATAYGDRGVIAHDRRIVAERRRGYKRHESFLDPLHVVAALERKPAWPDHVPAIRDWNLPESFQRLRKTFKEPLGPRTGERHSIRVLPLLMRHPAARIDQAIGRRIHRSTVTAKGIARAVDRWAESDNTQLPSGRLSRQRATSFAVFRAVCR
jgi:hypothetical protein